MGGRFIISPMNVDRSGSRRVAKGLVRIMQGRNSRLALQHRHCWHVSERKRVHPSPTVFSLAYNGQGLWLCEVQPCARGMAHNPMLPAVFLTLKS